MTAVHTRTFTAHHPREPMKFDPRRVKIGVVVLMAAAFGLGALANGATSSLDKVAGDVTAVCREGGPAGTQLAERGSCAAADQAQQVGPYVVQGAPGGAGADGDRGPPGGPGKPGANSQVPGPGGAPGQPGADSTVPGSPGKGGEPGADSTVPGPAGQNGTDGVSPACLSEPGQCRGEKGDPGPPGSDSTVAGPPGAQGAPGPACPDGTSLQPVMFASGQEGLGCVKPADSEEGMP